ncbi:MAG: hypothetical protein LBD31_07860 [Treponema sp.]|jgi:hypothetical protein|nr:hypothetical protein [Treponema sp.]
MADLPSPGWTALRVFTHPRLALRGFQCVGTILGKFFFFQFRSVLFSGAPPISRADHALDEHIPFNPRFVRIYLDFTAFWIRIAGFLCLRYGKRGIALAEEFIGSVTALYRAAFRVYRKNLSTTNRPKYKRGFSFRLIHALDPHLMCIPSLHVMIVLHGYSKFRAYAKAMGEAELLQPLADRIFRGALTIIEAVLYVKQHSVNCVAAAMYALGRFTPPCFTEGDAETFTACLFGEEDVPAEYAPFYGPPLVEKENIPPLREYILGLYRRFGDSAGEDWTAPLLDFLGNLPRRVPSRGRP